MASSALVPKSWLPGPGPGSGSSNTAKASPEAQVRVIRPGQAFSFHFLLLFELCSWTGLSWVQLQLGRFSIVSLSTALAYSLKILDPAHTCFFFFCVTSRLLLVLAKS